MRGTTNTTNHDARTSAEPLCTNEVAATLPDMLQQLVVGRRGFGLRDQEEHRTQLASVVATCHSRVHTQQQAAVSHRAGLGCLVEKNTDFCIKRLGTSLLGQRRLECPSLGPSEVRSARLFAVPDTAAVDVVLDFRDLRTAVPFWGHLNSNFKKSAAKNRCRFEKLNHTSFVLYQYVVTIPRADPISYKNPVSICPNTVLTLFSVEL